jgi:hypothetical protein
MRSSNIERKKEVVQFHDFWYYSSKKIWSIWFCDIEFWFPLLREPGTKSQFWTMTQESFFRSYRARGTPLADQRILGWDELERATGIPIRPLSELFSSFVHLFSEVDQIGISWVHQFYAIVWIHAEHDFIGFMLDGRPE